MYTPKSMSEKQHFFILFCLSSLHRASFPSISVFYAEQTKKKVLLARYSTIVIDSLNNAGCGILCARFLLRDWLFCIILMGQCRNLIGCAVARMRCLGLATTPWLDTLNQFARWLTLSSIQKTRSSLLTRRKKLYADTSSVVCETCLLHRYVRFQHACTQFFFAWSIWRDCYTRERNALGSVRRLHSKWCICTVTGTSV